MRFQHCSSSKMQCDKRMSKQDVAMRKEQELDFFAVVLRMCLLKKILRKILLIWYYLWSEFSPISAFVIATLLKSLTTILQQRRQRSRSCFSVWYIVQWNWIPSYKIFLVVVFITFFPSCYSQPKKIVKVFRYPREGQIWDSLVKFIREGWVGWNSKRFELVPSKARGSKRVLQFSKGLTGNELFPSLVKNTAMGLKTLRYP